MWRKIKRKFNNLSKTQVMIGACSLCILFITIGYAVMSQVLKINGYASIDRGDGMIFTSIETGENNGASINVSPNIKAKTMVNTDVSFSEPGTVTFNVSAKNHGKYDAKLIAIEKLEHVNNSDPTCINVSIENHAINDLVYTQDTKDFQVKVTSTCTTLSSKEIEVYFKYAKEELGEIISGIASEVLINEKLEKDVSPTESGLVAIDNAGEITTVTTPREYRYIGPSPDNYVEFNDELWRIIGIFDGRLKIIRKDSIGNMAWDKSASNGGHGTHGENNWKKATLQMYLNGEYLTGINVDDQNKIVNNLWKLGGNTNSRITPQVFYDKENSTNVYAGNPVEWTGKIALIYTSDYGFATSGGVSTNRNACLAKSLYSWDGRADCKNNNWLYDSAVNQWTLTPHTGRNDYTFFVIKNGSVSMISAKSTYGIRPVLFLTSETEITSGLGSETNPYILK